MEIVRIIAQLVIALGILNVWLLRSRRATPYRGGGAQNIREEFSAYGLPPGVMYVVGTLKVLLAILLLIGLWVPVLVDPAALGLAVLMLGAIVMHFKIKDPVSKSLPALGVLLLTLIVVLL